MDLKSLHNRDRCGTSPRFPGTLWTAAQPDIRLGCPSGNYHKMPKMTWWWFQICFIFTPTGGDDPN